MIESNDWIVSIEYTNHNGELVESTFNTSRSQLSEIIDKLTDELCRCASCHFNAHLSWEQRKTRTK